MEFIAKITVRILIFFIMILTAGLSYPVYLLFELAGFESLAVIPVIFFCGSSWLVAGFLSAVVTEGEFLWPVVKNKHEHGVDFIKFGPISSLLPKKICFECFRQD